MDSWSQRYAEENIYKYTALTDNEQADLCAYLNTHFPPPVFEEQRQQRRNALNNLAYNQNILSRVTQHYPACIKSNEISSSPQDLAGYAIMLTAGGEGERLRHSLLKQGITPQQLQNFSKATFPLPEFYKDFGTLHVNLSIISHISRSTGLSIPVIVTTGPDASITAQVIPQIIDTYHSFGLENLCILTQEERLHLSSDEQIVYTLINRNPRPVTNPDETGGPVMKLKKTMRGSSHNTLTWLRQRGCSKIILLQATALYDETLIMTIASAGKQHDGLGLGIVRTSFSEDDPYGTYILTEDRKHTRLVIVEKEVRNTAMRTLRDTRTGTYLPLNTGFYAFDLSLIEHHDLPDYATPPKEIGPDIPRSPKIGYAATDILPFAANPAVLTIDPDSYGVIKNAEDLIRLSQLGKKLGLDKICKAMHEH